MSKKIRTIDMTPPSPGQDVNVRWWMEEQPHTHAWSIAKKLQMDASARRQDNLRHARLYSNKQYLSLQMNPVARNTRTLGDAARLTLNVIKSCVDTACSKISQSRPRPMFLTSGGDWKLARKAKQLTKYIDGLFDTENVYQLGQLIFRDSLIFGTGICKVLNDGRSVKFERVLPDELLVDESEAFYGSPRQLHQRRFMSREVLAELFPDHTAAIHASQTSFAEEDSSNPDLIAVIESWHLRSGPEAKDGKRVVSISEATLVDEPWDHDYFPFAFLRWNEGLTGFWGMGLTEEITSIQIEVNKILRNIQSAQNICSVPRVFVEAGSSVNGASLQANPDGLSVVRYTGNAPNFLTASAMPGEIYSHLDRLVNKAYEITGVSQLSAQSKKPAGLDSGVALRTMQDVESERFVLVGQRYEEFFLQLARLAVEESKVLFEENPKLNVMVAVKGRTEKIAWKEVNMARDEYLLRCFPTSLLPTSPAGRLQAVQELMQGGLIDQNQGLALLDFPDLERAMGLNTSAYEDVVQTLERIVEEGIYDTPEPYQDLVLSIKLGQSMYLQSRSHNVPADRLELLRRYIDDCDRLLSSKQEAEAPSAPVEQVAPVLAQPATPPVSELMPMGTGIQPL